MNQPTVSEVKEATFSDAASKRNGAFTVRRGFFYTHGQTSEKFAQRVVEAMKTAGFEVKVEDHGEVWKPFRGGASVRNSSHWWVTFTVVSAIQSEG